MSEKIPQSNSENNSHKRFLVTRSNGEIQSGRLTHRTKIKHVLQSNGTYKDMTLREVEFPKTIGPDGREGIPTKMISQFALSDDFQANLAEQLHDGLYDPQPEEVVAGEPNDFDNLFSDDYDEEDYSVEGAAERGIDTESRRQEMLEYADVALSGAMRNDTDLQYVIESAFAQADRQLPSEKESLIDTMRTDARVRANIQQYLREKAEYYRSDLPERVRKNGDKRPGYPGGVPEPSLDVATKYAVSMITGEWDQAREDGESEYDTAGNVTVGQHRAAARMILMSPRMISKEQ